MVTINFIKPKLRKLFHRTHLFFQLLSLDIVLGALGGYAFACKVLDQEISLSVSIILAVAVWITYISDHLLDTLSAVNQSKYAFFSKNRRFFLIFLTLLSLAEVFLIFHFLTLMLIFTGMLIGSGLFIYLFLQHFIKGRLRRFFPKEILISSIYIFAVWFYPLAITTRLPKEPIVLILLHFILVYSNVSLFSYFEREKDTMNLQFSLLTMLNEKKLKFIILSIIVLGFMLSAYLVVFENLLSAMFLLIIFTIYLFVLVYSENDQVRKRYADITDGSFLIFLLFLFL